MRKSWRVPCTVSGKKREGTSPRPEPAGQAEWGGEWRTGGGCSPPGQPAHCWDSHHQHGSRFRQRAATSRMRLSPNAQASGSCLQRIQARPLAAPTRGQWQRLETFRLSQLEVAVQLASSGWGQGCGCICSDARDSALPPNAGAHLG